MTGTRAEFGLLTPLMRLFQKHKEYQLQIVVTGMHLAPEFGLTYKEVEREGFDITEKVEILLSSDTKVGMAKSTGLALLSFPEVFERLKPITVVVLGDRYETFAATTAAFLLNIPVCHISGGDVTEGAVDDAFRHSITKMSSLHFATMEKYKKRVIQLGEQPDTVYNVGGLGIDNIINTQLLNLKEFKEQIDWPELKKFFLITYHPVTLDNTSVDAQMQAIFDALDVYKEYDIIFTLPNSDAHGREIITLIKAYEQKSNGRVKTFTSLGQKRYLSAIQHAELIIGNSSSGVVEVPSFKKASINIGNRQAGREAAKSVLNCGNAVVEIEQAIALALSSDFQESLKHIENIYGSGQTADAIFTIIEKTNFENLKKKFYDINF